MNNVKPQRKKKYLTNYHVGDDNIRTMGFDFHNPVFFASSLLIFIFVVGTLLFPEVANQAFETTKLWSIKHFDWLFTASVNFFLLVCLCIAIFPFGKIRLGGENADTEFSNLSWLAMLFSAGMGIGLMFWSVAEPVAYFTDWYGKPLNNSLIGDEKKHLAMGTTMFHWGFHAWSIYAIVGVSMAFFSFNLNLPFTLRSCVFPIFGERVWKSLGNFIDTIAVLATIFGLATSLGFGAKQAASGLSYLFAIEDTINLQIAIIFGVTAVAIYSVAKGLERGIRILSNINCSLALLLLFFLLVTSGTSAVVNGLSTTVIGYINYIVPLSQWLVREDQTFYHGWTVFYWAWWISWSPFVGMFMARISKGRTVREFLIAVLFIPTLLTLVWMSVFGGQGIEQIESAQGALAQGLGNTALALFQMLENLPYSALISVLALILIMIFFITSSDSGSLVIDNITAGGRFNAPVLQRIFWSTLEGVIAIVLLFGGGQNALGALQAAAITVGLPFTFILLIMSISLLMSLNDEWKYYNDCNNFN